MTKVQFMLRTLLIIIGIIILSHFTTACGALGKKENQQQQHKKSMNISTIVDDTPVTTTEYEEYIENELSDAASEIIHENAVRVKLDITDDFNIQTANIDVGDYVLSDS